MRGDTTIRGAAALVLITYCVLIVSLYDPLPVSVDFELALPIGLALGVGLIAIWYRTTRMV